MKTSPRFFHLLLLFLAAFLSACAAPTAEIPPTAAALQNVPWLDLPTAVPTPTFAPDEKESATAVATPENETPHISLPLSIYIIDSEDDSFNSARNEEEIRQIIVRANTIWAQANIELELQTIERITLPDNVMTGIVRGDFSSFFADVTSQFAVPNPSLINGFFAQQIGGPNGIVPFNSRVFFITDEPSVLDERVTAHEIGHILGLHHVLDDSERLMFSGTNGINLSDEEILVARYAAQGTLNRVR